MNPKILKMLLSLIGLLLLFGCESVKIRDFGGLNTDIERETVYVVPFDATLVPADFGEPLFNDFIDRLNAQHKGTKITRFLILKEELKDVEPSWLVKQTYLSGDLWGYVENSGCCSTEMKVKSRIYLYEPGKTEPSLEIFVPIEDFFEHDRISTTAAKARMSKKLAWKLADTLIKKFTPK